MQFISYLIVNYRLARVTRMRKTMQTMCILLDKKLFDSLPGMRLNSHHFRGDYNII